MSLGKEQNSVLQEIRLERKRDNELGEGGQRPSHHTNHTLQVPEWKLKMHHQISFACVTPGRCSSYCALVLPSHCFFFTGPALLPLGIKEGSRKVGAKIVLTSGRRGSGSDGDLENPTEQATCSFNRYFSFA